MANGLKENDAMTTCQIILGVAGMFGVIFALAWLTALVSEDNEHRFDDDDDG